MSEGIKGVGEQAWNCLGRFNKKVYQDIIRPLVKELRKEPTDENLCYKRVFSCLHSDRSVGAERVLLCYCCAVVAVAAEEVCPDPSCNTCFAKGCCISLWCFCDSTGMAFEVERGFRECCRCCLGVKEQKMTE